LSAKPRYVVGIDLGTTNSALASVDTAPGDAEKPTIQMFPVPQVVAPGQVDTRATLPSYLYVLGANELPPAAVALPWDPAPSSIAGDFARARGSEVPARLVASAKSWLSHPGIDRTAPVLPWGRSPDSRKSFPRPKRGSVDRVASSSATRAPNRCSG